MTVIVGNQAIGVGGKADSLRWLVEAGFSCPAFDAIDISCWDGFLASEEAERHRDTLCYTRDQYAFSLAALQLRGEIESAPLPEPVSRWLDADPLSRIGAPVAVRSSAASEDGAGSSSAGQYESVLGVDANERLEAALREVLASYFGERALLYRRSHEIDDGDHLAMGVVVQRLVDATAAGIAFSVDPVTGSDSQVVIEATTGLGSTLVAGETDPDRFDVDKSTLRVSARLGRKETIVRYDAARGLLREEREPPGELALPLEVVQEIASAVARMHRLRGRPVDVEWAVGADGQPWYVQIRPVTTAKQPTLSTTLSESF